MFVKTILLSIFFIQAFHHQLMVTQLRTRHFPCVNPRPSNRWFCPAPLSLHKALLGRRVCVSVISDVKTIKLSGGQRERMPTSVWGSAVFRGVALHGTAKIFPPPEKRMTTSVWDSRQYIGDPHPTNFYSIWFLKLFNMHSFKKCSILFDRVILKTFQSHLAT